MAAQCGGLSGIGPEGNGEVLPAYQMEEWVIRQQQEMEEDQCWLEKEERFMKPDVRLS